MPRPAPLNNQDRHLIWIAAFSILVWMKDAVGAPVSFNTALPVAKGEFVFREQFVVSQSGHDPSTADRERQAWSAVSVLGYGLTG